MIEVLSDPEFQKTIGFYGGGAATVIGGLWVAYTKLRSKPKPTSPAPPTAQAQHGLAAGADLTVTGDVNISSTPKAAWGVLAIGVVLLGAVALFGPGDCDVSQSGVGVAACGDAEGITITQ